VSARREGKWMHYRIESPRSEAAAAVLGKTLDSLRHDRQMQADLAILDRACCQPQEFVPLLGAPAPVRIPLQ
jgi:ArsR family transcriptional regulator